MQPPRLDGVPQLSFQVDRHEEKGIMTCENCGIQKTSTQGHAGAGNLVGTKVIRAPAEKPLLCSSPGVHCWWERGKGCSIKTRAVLKRTRECATTVGGDWRLAVGGNWRLAVGGDWRLAVGGDWRLAAIGGWRLVAIGGWRLVAIGGWRLVAIGGWWRLAVGGWWRLAVGGWWRLAVGGWWRLAVGGVWWLAVGGPWGRSLAKKNKLGSLRTALVKGDHSRQLPVDGE